MSICHLYDKQEYAHIQSFLNTFQGSTSLQIESIKSLQEHEAYIIELNEVNKEVSLQIKRLFEDKNQALIYFIVPKSHSLMFFQLTYLIGAKDLIAQSQDPKKIIKKIISDKEKHIEYIFENFLGKENIKNNNYLFYNNMELEKITPSLLQLFKCEDVHEFKENILNQLDIKKLLNEDRTFEVIIQNLYHKDESYTIKTLSFLNKKIISFTKNIISEKNLAFISSRATFIELLKDKHIQNSIVKNKLSAMSINIKNLDTIKNSLSSIDFEYLMLDFLSYMESILEKKIIFSELEKDFYVVLFENITDEERKEITSNFNTKMLKYISEQDNKPFLDIYTLSLSIVPFDEILSTLENIFFQRISYSEETAFNIIHTSNIQNVISEKTLLEQTFKYGTSLKLLNIYKGLVIKTKSKILKVTQDTIYVQFEALQGVVIDLERETILQAPSFIQDIQAKVKVIDLHKKIAVLEKFHFLKTNLNARQYSRVTMANYTPVSVRFDNGTLSGSVIDISIKSIAIKTKYTDQVRSIKGQTARLTYNIPSNKSEDGYYSVSLDCIITATTMQDTDNNCKLICLLDEETHDISHVMEFIYERQKNLIIELKKISKLN